MTGWRAGIAATCLMLALWQTVIWSTGVARFILPPPALVAQTIWDSRALLAEHAVITMAEVLIGLLLGAALGFVSAIGLVASPTARALVRPILVFSQSVPVFALAPILTLWLGFGLWSKITMALIIIYFPVTSSFFDALMRTNRDWIGTHRRDHWRMGGGLKGLGVSDASGKWPRQNRPDVRRSDRACDPNDPAARGGE